MNNSINPLMIISIVVFAVCALLYGGAALAYINAPENPAAQSVWNHATVWVPSIMGIILGYWFGSREAQTKNSNKLDEA